MTKERKLLILVSVIVISSAVLAIVQSFKSGGPTEEDKLITEQTKARIEDKAKRYSPAPEIKNFDLKSLIGKKVILVSFWSSACPNCQKNIAHLNAWYDKYKDAGLEIVGVHTPQFEFEKDPAVIKSAALRFGIKYPVADDSDYQTWKNYKNANWPNTYLIDTDGFVVYAHIGEGSYDETERKIQELLGAKDGALDAGNSEAIEFPGSPAFYFSHNRNSLLANGKAYIPGVQTLKLPKVIELNKLYLSGTWNFQSQYTESGTTNAKIVIKYNAKEVYLVAGSLGGVTLSISQDGKPILQGAVTDTGLYQLITNDSAGEHLLEITVDKAGLRAYAMEFR